jgi:tetratricopeptide (TPR) repeat protein
VRGRLARLLPLALAIAVVAATGAEAQYGGGGGDAQAKEGEAERPKRRWGRPDEGGKGAFGPTYTVDERTGKKLGQALEELQAERYDEASEVLDQLRLRSLNPFERAQVFRIRAFVAYGKNDLPDAREQLEKAVAEGALPPEDQAAIRYQIAQLYLAEERWQDVVAHLQQWFAMVDDPNAAAYYLLAIAYYQLEDLESALPPARKAVELGNPPQEGALQLLLALRLTNKEYRESIPLLEALIEHHPKKSYWIQLSTVHGALGDYEAALVPLQLAYSQGLLTEDGELRRLAQLLLFLELPYRAALVMSEGLTAEHVEPDSPAYELLSNSWIAAREYDRAVQPLARAAQLAESGDLYLRLAQVHIQREKWGDAAEALRNALDKGRLASPGDAQLLMGIAFYSQKRPEQARRWFARALRHEGTRSEAETWLAHIDRELQSG